MRKLALFANRKIDSYRAAIWSLVIFGWYVASATASADTAADELTEVTVTAQKLVFAVLSGQPIVDTPYSIYAVDRLQIQNIQASNINDAVRYAGSIAPESNDIYAASTRISRGFESSTFIDGVPATNYEIEPPIQLYDNVQALIGPAAFFFGFATPGGILSLQSKRPTSTPLIEASLEYTSKAHVGITADFSDSTADGQFGARLIVHREEGELNYFSDHLTKNSIGLNVDWRISDQTTIELDNIYSDRYIDGLNTVLFTNYTTGGSPPPLNATKNYQGPGSFDQAKLNGTRLNLIQNIGSDWNIKVSGQYYDAYDNERNVTTYLNDPAGDVELYGGSFAQEDQVMTYQVVLHGQMATGPLSHEVNIGGLYTRDRTLYALATTGGPFDVFQDFGQTNILNYSAPDVRGLETLSFDDKTLYLTDTQRSAFISDRATIGALSVIAGVRRSQEFTNDVLFGAGRGSNSAWSPTGAISFKPTPLSSVYASYAEGIEPGQQALYGTTNQDERFGAVKSRQYEVGYKYEGPRGSASFAAFDLTRSGYLYFTTLPGNTLPTTFSGGEQRNRGFSFDGNVLPFSWLRILGGAQYLDARVSGVPADQASDHPPGIPKFQEKLLVEGAIPVAENPLFVSANVENYGHTTVGALASIYSPGYTTFGIGAREAFKIADFKNLTVRFNVDNLTNKSYYQAKFDGFVPGEPRTIKVSLTTSF